MKTASSLLLFALIVVAIPLLADRKEPNSGDLDARFAAPLRAIHEAQLQELRPLLTESEAEALAELAGHASKQAFIDALWRQLDHEKATPRNEARERWSRQARHLQGVSLPPGDDPVRVRRLAGPPTLEANLSGLCTELRPIVIWFYDLGVGSRCTRSSSRLDRASRRAPAASSCGGPSEESRGWHRSARRGPA